MDKSQYAAKGKSYIELGEVFFWTDTTQWFASGARMKCKMWKKKIIPIITFKFLKKNNYEFKIFPLQA